MVANHEVIHLSLVLALPLSYSMYESYACKLYDAGEELVASFWWVHIYCTLSALLAYFLIRCEQHEWGKFFEISRVPIYLYYIF